MVKTIHLANEKMSKKVKKLSLILTQYFSKKIEKIDEKCRFFFYQISIILSYLKLSIWCSF